MKCIKYPSTGQYRDVIKRVREISKIKGLTLPRLTFRGTVKLHGTNAAIRYSSSEGLSVQSRNGVYTEKDMQIDKNAGHLGFTDFVMVSNREKILQYVTNIYNEYSLSNETLLIYGEWAGKGIQKGVAISELSKRFYIFDICVVPTTLNDTSDTSNDKDKTEIQKSNDETEDQDQDQDDNTYDTYGRVWKDITLLKTEVPEGLSISLITNFPTYKIDIDFLSPELSQNSLVKITNDVENECPVSKAYDVSGCGEGVVWSTHWLSERLIFKVKGAKHSISKVKTLASVDPEVVKSIDAFCTYAVTENRVDQALSETNVNLDISKIGDTLKWIANDIIKEESDVLSRSGLLWKNVAKKVAEKTRSMILAKM